MTAAGDTGTRNDGAAPTQTATIQVQRAPCGRWQHKSWKAGTLEWSTDSNGDPEPVTPTNAIETVEWVDECGGENKPNEERSVSYTLVSDEAVEIEGVWHRKVEYRAYSTCAGGTDSELLSGERALPRHWSVPGELDGGSMTIALTGEATGLSSPGVVTPASTTALILPVNGGVSLSISGAKDGDTYSYWNVPEKEATDTLRYKWTVTNEAGASSDPVTGEAFSWSGTKPGTYVISGIVDDAWGVDEDGNAESGVTAPDMGERNDDEISTLVAVTIVGKEWNAGKEIGYHPKEDASGQRIEPVEWVEDGKIKLPKLGDATKAVPGEAVELEVNPASDWDAWTRAGIDSGIAADGPLTYKWTASGGKFRVTDGQGNVSEVTTVSGLKATWIAPTDEGNYTLTCEIDDAAGARVGEDETGSHDDEPLQRTVSIAVVPSYWSPYDKGIGYHPTLDEATQQPIKPYEWHEDGRITAPIDQRLENAPKEKIVLPGQEVTATIEEAQDWDTLTTLEGKSIARDETLTYVWSSGEVGHFLIPAPNGGPPTQAATATGLSVKWVAPDDIEEDTEVELKCTVDDGEGTPVVAPLVGTRDDEKLERVVKIKVVLPSVKFAGELIQDNSLLRACAGGVDDHAAIDPEPDPLKRNDSQYRAHTRKIEVTLTRKNPETGEDEPLANTKFTLGFEGNKGHALFGDGKNKTARLHNANELFDAEHPWVETLEVTSDADGNVEVWVLSSDVINKPTLQAMLKLKPESEPVKIGEVECDFAAPISFRNFADATGNDPDDDGWLFYFPYRNASGQTKEENSYLAKEGQSMPAKIYLKFEVQPGASDSSDEPQRSKWQFVNGHEVDLVLSSALVYLQKISDSDSTNATVLLQPNPINSSGLANVESHSVELIPSPDGSQEDNDGTEFGGRYGMSNDETISETNSSEEPTIVTDTQLLLTIADLGQNALSKVVTTKSDGAGQVLITAKKNIYAVKSLNLSAVNNSVWDN